MPQLILSITKLAYIYAAIGFSIKKKKKEKNKNQENTKIRISASVLQCI